MLDFLLHFIHGCPKEPAGAEIGDDPAERFFSDNRHYGGTFKASRAWQFSILQEFQIDNEDIKDYVSPMFCYFKLKAFLSDIFITKSGF